MNIGPVKAELKPCPFCNGKAVLENVIMEAVVRCLDCGARIKRPHNSTDDAGIEAAQLAWNKRV